MKTGAIGDMGNKVAVCTYCTIESYGSMLQSYGLKCALTNLGLDSIILSEHPKRDVHYKIKLNKNDCIREKVKKILQIIIDKKLLLQLKKSQKFIDEYLDVEYFDGYNSVKSTPQTFDYYISGSDQVLNPINCNPLFFLDFVNDKNKCFSYAASLGNNIIPANNEDTFKQMICNFKCLSIREYNSIQVLRQYTDVDIEVNIDPTFMLSSQQWKSIEEEYLIKKPYILVYPIYWDRSYNQELKKLHKSTGLDVYVLSDSLNKVWGNKKIYDAGLREFIWLIRNAEYVITSSFHGTVMSIIFNKQFVSLYDSSNPSRIKCLLDTFGIRDIQICDLIDKKISYNEINDIIISEREKGIDYLRKELKSDKQY